jgi:hypothetical protein
LSAVELVAEVADQGAYGVVAITETLGDLRHRLVLDEDGAEDFVAAMGRVGGLEEEGRVADIVHG